MTKVHFLTCGWLHAPGRPRVPCRCLLLEDVSGLALVDTGIGLKDVKRPVERVGEEAIRAAGFEFHEADTAVRQLEGRGLRAEDVNHIVLTHGDPDHVGGLADFPWARVHLSAKEHTAVTLGRPKPPWPRYRAAQFAHGPRWEAQASTGETWFGLEARAVPLGFAADVLLVSLPGHTVGHCGVAVQQEDGWLLHAGDAYYLGEELVRDDSPISALARHNAVDDGERVATIQALRAVMREHGGAITLVNTHDPEGA